ncbi:MAG: hypothetical protein NW215_15365 [Hyphomicrobiales bacterium]|nr:hypothetical protein [Hyphomicrobiales bacterium]
MMYTDGVLVETKNNYAENSALLTYTLTPLDAFGIRVDYMRDDEQWLTTATYSRLLKRWNAPDSQANIWATVGAGVMSGGKGDRLDRMSDDDAMGAATLGVSADWESRRWYLSYENRLVYTSDDSEFHQSARVGVAPYIGDYNGVNLWLMVQFDHRPDEDEEFAVTPFVRLYNKRLMGEIGVSSTGDILFNASVQF